MNLEANRAAHFSRILTAPHQAARMEGDTDMKSPKAGLVVLLLIAAIIVSSVGYGIDASMAAKAYRESAAEARESAYEAAAIATEAQDRAAMLLEDRDGLRSQVESLTSAVETLTTQLESRDSQIDALEDAYDDAQFEIRSLESRVSSSASRSGSSAGWSSARASWYGPGFYGRSTASGATLTEGMMNCAHRSLPFGTRIQFEYNGRTATAVVNDRGPFIAGRTFDLGPGTAHALGFSGVGTVKYRVL